MLILFLSSAIDSSSDILLSLKKYIKLLFATETFADDSIIYINKAINYFIAGCSIILILSFLKHYGAIQPLSFAKFCYFSR